METKRIKAMFSGSDNWQPITETMKRRFNQSSAGPVADPVSGFDATGYKYARCVSKGDPWTCAIWELCKDGVLVEVMPAHYRESHRAAGNWGQFPFNGAVRMLVDEAEAEALLDDPDGYNRILEA